MIKDNFAIRKINVKIKPMEIKELIQFCKINKDVLVDYPFKDKRYGKIPILRHKSNNKWFGVIFYLNDTLYINLKAEPDVISILKEQYQDIITPAWHMNKIHWCKVDINKIDKEVLKQLIKRSFDITKSKKG